MLGVLPGSVQVDDVHVDLAKAFDHVNHNTLIDKLKATSIDDTLLSWVEIYLSGRSKSVKIDSHCSRTFNITSGVSQGSHLEPILFCFFINNLKLFLRVNGTIAGEALQRTLFVNDLGVLLDSHLTRKVPAQLFGL